MAAVPPSFSQSAPSDLALVCLAVLERAGRSVLETVAQIELYPEIERELASHPDVTCDGETWTISARAAGEILAGLLERDIALYRDAHSRSLDYLRAALERDALPAAGAEALEAVFSRVLERLGDRLMNDDPDRFAAVVAQVQAVPLRTPRARQLRSYFSALALRKAARHEEALAAFDALLAEPGLDEHIRGRAINSRAVLCRIMGRLEEALSGYQESLSIWQRRGDALNAGKVLLNLGIIHYQLQDYPAAQARLSEAAERFTQTGSAQWLAAVHNELGLVHRDLGEWDRALAHFEQAVAQRRAEQAEDSLGLALNNVGEVLLFQGRFEAALQALREAGEKIRTQAYRVDVDLNLGLAHQARGELEQAMGAYRQALERAQAIERREILPQAHYRLGDVQARAGQPEAARASLAAGAAEIEAIRAPLQREDLKIGLLGRWQQVFEALVLLNQEMGDAEAALLWAERSRARAFADLLQAEGLPADGGAALPASGAPIPGAGDLRASLGPDETVLCYFTTGVLERDVPLLQALAAENPLRPHLLTPARTLLFVLTQSEFQLLTCELEPNLLTGRAGRPPDPRRWLLPAMRARLHRALIAPAGAAAWKPRVTVIPHGPLHHVPFVSLWPDADPGGRAPVLVHAPSLTLLPHRRTAQQPPPGESSRPGAGLALGYRGRRALPFAEPEAQAVAGLLDGQVLVGETPKKEAARRAAAPAPWVHFACHGMFDYEHPLESYLETGPGELLTAREVLRDWRLQARLVTLSACETGLSRVLRSDEPIGLIRAFLAAGAQAVLVSRWAVEDLATFLLMARLYQKLAVQPAAGLGAALQDSQAWLRTLTVQGARVFVRELARPDIPPGAALDGLPPEVRPFADPRYWAAFELFGKAD